MTRRVQCKIQKNLSTEELSLFGLEGICSPPNLDTRNFRANPYSTYGPVPVPDVGTGFEYVGRGRGAVVAGGGAGGAGGGAGGG